MKLSRKDIQQRLRELSRDNCINWRGSAIRSGDNVLCLAHDRAAPLPCQIIDIQDYRDIGKKERASISNKPKDLRTRMVLIRHREVLCGKDVRAPDCTKYFHVPECLKEVVDTVILEWIPAFAVSSPCFIFHVDSIQKGLFTCKGMERLFYIRFQKTRNGKFIPLQEKDWEPFYRDPKHPEIESFPEALWTNLICLKQEVQKAMCRGGQWNGRTSSAKLVGMHPSFFRYLKDEMDSLIEEEVIPHPIRFTRSRKVLYDNLAASRKKLKFNGKMIRVIEEEHLDAVRKIFGISFGVGVMQTVPSFKALKENPSLNDTVWLRNSDPVRIVTCLQQVDDLDPEKARPALPLIARSTDGVFCCRRPTKLICSFRGLDIWFTSSVGF
jgi:hypothetical protein